MKKLLLALVLWPSLAFAQTLGPPTGSSGSAFPPTGCATANGVIFNNATPCDTGFTYAGSGGNIAFTGTLSGPVGAANNTTYNFGTVGTGLFGSSTAVIASSSGTATLTIGPAALTTALSFFLSSTLTIQWNNDTILSRGGAAATLKLGAFADVAAPIAQTLGVQNVVAGTSNTGGANFTFNASKSTGTGVGGKVILQTTVTGTTGTTVNTNFPMLTLNPGSATTSTVQFGDGTNITAYDSCTALTTGATGIVACTASAARFKTIHDSVSPDQASRALDTLRVGAPTWNYIDPERFGTGTRVGLIADDVAAMDPRCVVKRDGEVADYWDRCIIAYLVADRQKMRAEIATMQSRLNR